MRSEWDSKVLSNDLLLLLFSPNSFGFLVVFCSLLGFSLLFSLGASAFYISLPKDSSVKPGGHFIQTPL